MRSSRWIFDELMIRTHDKKELNKDERTWETVNHSFMICAVSCESSATDESSNEFDIGNHLIAKANDTQQNDHRALLVQIQDVLKDFIATLNDEIVTLSQFYVSTILNRSIIQKKMSEREALVSVLSANSFAEMSLIAGIEKEHSPIFASNTLVESLLKSLSEADNADDFFHKNKHILIFRSASYV